MTVKELSQLYYLNKQIARDQRELEQLEAQVGARSPKMDDMPHAKGGQASEVERLAVEMTALRDLLRARINRRVIERKRLQDFIDQVDPVKTSHIFELRFVDCMSWAQVADAVGGGNTAESCKKACYRYLDEYNKKQV